MSESPWNQIFAKQAFHYGTDANDWVVSSIERYVLNGQWFAVLGVDQPDELHIVELASGEGRNAVWLARQGFQVTAFDQSTTGIQKTEQLADRAGVAITARPDDAIEIGLHSPGWQGQADVAISTFFHVPPQQKRDMLAAHRRLVRPGGLVVAEWFHPDQRTQNFESGGPPRADMMLSVPEVRTAFGEWHILECQTRVRNLDEGTGHRGQAAVTQLVAQKPTPWF